VVLYLRGHEGRGIGLLSKLRAYELQDGGADTVDANLSLGLPVDAREYSAGAQMLADLGLDSVRLLTNNPAKIQGLSDMGIKVTGRVPLPVAATPDNLRYLLAKRDRLGHQLAGLPEATPAPPVLDAGDTGVGGAGAGGTADAAEVPASTDVPTSAGAVTSLGAVASAAPEPSAQPGVAQPGVAQPGVAQPGVAQPGVAAQPGAAARLAAGSR
jgi:3,4-dihydroxy 2-butanone 4-phosphate synthase/GTP cyclohydrolase II